MPALEFTEADLRANQQGELGETQRQHLTRLRQRALMVGATVFFGLVFLATLLLFFGQANANGILTLLGILLTMLNAVGNGYVCSSMDAPQQRYSKRPSRSCYRHT
jgi:hypothetical protein